MHRIGSGADFYRWRFVIDGLAAVAAWYAAIWLRIHVDVPFTAQTLHPSRMEMAHLFAPAVFALQVGLLYLFGFYDRSEPSSLSRMGVRLAAKISLQGLLAGTFLFLTRLAVPRSTLPLFLLFNFLLLFSWRAAIRFVYPRRAIKVLLVGHGCEAVELAEAIRRGRHGPKLVGYLDVDEGDEAPEERSKSLGPRVGTLADVVRLAEEELFEVLIAATPNFVWMAAVIDRLAGVRSRPSVLLLPGPVESLIGRVRYRWISDIPLIEVMRSREWSRRLPMKRLIDILAGTTLLVLALPLMAVSAVAIRATSPGPIFYQQTRVGRGRREFTLVKFRTMIENAEKAGEVLAEEQDPRLTPIGGFLRRTRLDELPQLLNVISGSMSLVGPRPERPGFVQQFLREIPGYAERFSMRPGLTGLAQINGEYHSSARNKLRYDLAYISNWSPWLDILILLRTVKTVLSFRGV